MDASTCMHGTHSHRPVVYAKRSSLRKSFIVESVRRDGGQRIVEDRSNEWDDERERRREGEVGPANKSKTSLALPRRVMPTYVEGETTQTHRQRYNYTRSRNMYTSAAKRWCDQSGWLPVSKSSNIASWEFITQTMPRTASPYIVFSSADLIFLPTTMLERSSSWPCCSLKTMNAWAVCFLLPDCEFLRPVKKTYRNWWNLKKFKIYLSIAVDYVIWRNCSTYPTVLRYERPAAPSLPQYYCTFSTGNSVSWKRYALHNR